MEKRNAGEKRGSWKPDSIMTWTAKKNDILMNCLEEKLTDHKRTAIKAMLKYGSVALNSMPLSQYNAPVAEGDRISVNFTRPFAVFSNPKMKLVYEDDDIIVVNKNNGLLSVSSDNVKDHTAYSLLRSYLKEKDPRLKLFIIHRLDRDTSGLMMFAKNIEAKEAMQHNWNNMVLNRKYVAVVEGVVSDAEGVVRSYLAENSQYVVYSTDNPEEGQLAITRYKRLKVGNGYSLMELELDTGRKNQIRVHMSDLGHPIAGDKKYGAKTSPLHRLALHARTLHFVHPITRKEMSFETPIPSRFLGMVK